MFGRADTNTTVGLWPGLLRAGVAVSITRFAIGCKPVWQHACPYGMYVVLSSCRLVVCRQLSCLRSLSKRRQHVQTAQTQPTAGSLCTRCTTPAVLVTS